MHRCRVPCDCLAICEGAQFHDHGAWAGLAPLGDEEWGAVPSAHSQSWWGPGCGTGMTLLSPGRLWWEAQRGQPSVRVLQGILPGHFDLSTTWKWGRCSLAWIGFPGQISPVLSQDSVNPTDQGGRTAFPAVTPGYRLSPQPLPPSPSIPLPSLHLDHTFPCRVAGTRT